MKNVFLAVLMMASASAMAAPTLTVCTGGQGGAYEALGKDIGKAIVDKVKVTSPTELQVLNTGGSVENAQRVTNGSCAMAIMQGDAVASRGLPRDIKVTNAHEEVIYWIHGKDGLKDFADISKAENKNLGIAIVNGSGAQITIENFGATDEDYKDLNLISFEDWEYAAEATANGQTRSAGKEVKIAGMLYVGRAGFLPGAITNDYSQDLSVGEINESNFTKAKDYNGTQLYTKCEINKGDTGPLKTDTFFKPDTLCMRAQVVFNNDYVNTMADADQRVMRKAVMQGTSQVLRNSR
ncbi:hypothetical protein FDI21_gp054 [Pseudomonas phage Noxifer]|uniref:Uncharacterized protein n=1 Tax=Pseudomonas phage Noxifer TaxID=2006684 RepID=A0A1Y0SXH0_9CAUD|nr:hypothetical protein FDI21_gp054 [Pseudomonas phage Noxifer]ARV77225.1 hypothetical protein NOXIFER_54 [Pseudomonas phage Noxifer]